MHPSFIFSTQASIPELQPVENLIIVIFVVVGIVIELAETSGNCFVAAGIVMAEKDNLFLAEFLNLGLKISLKLKIEAWVRKSDASRHQRCNEASF